MILTIAGKELRMLFASPLAWIVLSIVQAITGYAFLRRLDDFLQAQPQLVQLASAPGVTELVAAPLFAATAIVLLVAAPLLGMRLIAEERRNHTMVLLTSAPISMSEIVLGKFLGHAVFLLLIVGLVAAMPLSLAGSTSLDYAWLGSLCLGLALLALGFAALSLYVSSLTTQPIVAALGAFAALLAMILMSDTAADGARERGWLVPAALAQIFSPLKNFEPLAKGIIDSSAIVCAILFTIVFLVLTIRRLDAQRLRG
jgi:ABC-2 type transport system permease protein